jgi:Reverse transcriptase (RNA-dependent DNA polymerase)
MEGIKQNSRTEKNIQNSEQTVAVTGESTIESGPPLPEQPTVVDLSKMTSLEAILTSIVGCKEVWPQEVLRAVIERFGRMPRNGWTISRAYYNNKFQIDVPPDVFKKKAQETLVTATGKQCTSRQYKLEPVKRAKTIDAYIEENTLSEAKIYNELKVKFLTKIKELASKSVGEIGATRKVSSLEMDKTKLDALNRIAGEHCLRTPPTNMKDIAMTYIAVQQCYQEATEKPYTPSLWRASIDSKISKLKHQVNILTKILNSKEVDQKSRSEAIKIMRDKRLVLDKPNNTREAIAELEDSILVYQKKIEMHEKRKDFRKENRKFELFTRKFYRALENEKEVEIKVPDSEVKDYWNSMWCEKKNEEGFDDYLMEYAPRELDPVFPSFSEFLNIIKFLPSWKAAGIDGIYNFFIQKLTTLHSTIYYMIREICIEGKVQEAWFYQGLTYLIPKGTPSKGSDFRPITCMSNLYKLTTKCVTEVMHLEVERRGLLSENQLGTVRRVQGAKEQALLDIAINKDSLNRLRTVWIDVKKAFDSVSHDYLMACIKALNFPAWMTNFITTIIGKWNLDIRLKGEKILNKKVNRGILQGDSLSPLLFVLCIDPLSKKLNSKFEKITIKTDGDSHLTNHLLFIDDLKLFSIKDDVVKEMVDETKKFFKTIGLELNVEKSATNTPICQSDAKLLEGIEGYKYLGIVESKESVPLKETFDKIKKEIGRRVDLLCQRPLNSANFI